MKVRSAEEHPNADSLRVYEMWTEEVGGVVVVANRETTYAEGDVVAVARVGAVLEDGTAIRKTRLRGIDSFGMALGKVDDPVGHDLSVRLGRAEISPKGSAQFTKWASVELLHNVRRVLVARGELHGDPLPKLGYRAKVKVDGTNAAIQALGDGEFAAQSRTRVLTPEDDNYGFARWAHEYAGYMGSLHTALGRAVIFGEWCGPGVQKRTAAARIDRKVFAVFAIQFGDPHRESARLLVDPARIAEVLPEHPDIFVLPWHAEVVEFDHGDMDQLEGAVARVNEIVVEVEEKDPWVASVFGVDGLGEGIVLYPVDGVAFDEDGRADRDAYVELMFKAKGERHQVVRQKAPAQVDPEVARSVAHFIELFVTEPRLEQALREACDGELAMPRLGHFLKWIGKDIAKESKAELEASGLEWKQVAKAVTQSARGWFIQGARALA